MIKVLQIGLGSNPGGIESCILNYHRNIDRTQFQFDYIDLYGDGIAYSELIHKLGGRIFSLPNCKREPINYSRQLINILERNRYDIVHINLLSAANIISAIVASHYGNSVVIVHSHNSSIPSGFHRRLLHSLNINILRRLPVRKFACGIQAGYWLWGDAFNSDDIIPNAIDVSKFRKNNELATEMRRKCGFEKENIVIGFVGRFSEQKNIFFLIDVLKKLLERDDRYRLLMVGDGILREPFLKKASDLNIHEYIYLAGKQKSTSEWYQAMDIFILPSLFEGFPVVGVEAQAAGLKCFMSDTISEEINITGTVSFFPTTDPTVWAENIIQDIDCKKYYIFPESYNIENAVLKLEEKYRSIIN